MQSYTDGSTHVDHAHPLRPFFAAIHRKFRLDYSLLSLAMLGVVCTLLLTATGCGYANPRTIVRAGPVYLEDSKDNDILLEGAEYNHKTGDLHIDKFTLRNNASDVRIANVEQLRLVNEQIRIHGENIAQSLGLITALAEKALPGLKINGPLGGSATASNAAVALLAEQVAALLAAKNDGLQTRPTSVAPVVADPIVIPASVPATKTQ